MKWVSYFTFKCCNYLYKIGKENELKIKISGGDETTITKVLVHTFYLRIHCFIWKNCLNGIIVNNLSLMVFSPSVTVLPAPPLGVTARFPMVLIVFECSTPRILFLASWNWRFSVSASVYFLNFWYVADRYPMALIVSGCSTPRILFLASRTCISSISSSVYFPKQEYVAARFSMALIVSGCSTPRMLFLAFRTWISSFSASVYFPKFLYVAARFPMALIVSGCSTPRILFLASRTCIPSLSALVYFLSL